MTSFDWEGMQRDKDALHRRAAELPFGEKLTRPPRRQDAVERDLDRWDVRVWLPAEHVGHDLGLGSARAPDQRVEVGVNAEAMEVGRVAEDPHAAR